MILNRHRFPVYLLALLVLGFEQNNFAQQKALIEVQSTVDTSTITIGDLINYSIIIEREARLRIEKPGEGLNLGMFEIKDYHFQEPLQKGGRVTERYDFTISVYDTGKFVIPPFPVAYFPNDTSNAFKIIEAPAIAIYVKSVLVGDEAKELKDIKFPLDIPFNYLFLISLGMVFILSAFLVYLAYRLWKRHKEKGYIFSPPPPPIPAHEVALKALQELYISELLEQKQYKEFFSRLSEIIRVYLEGRYFFLALEETTPEIMFDFSRNEENPELKSELQNILELSDLIKFAKYIPDLSEIDLVKEQALNFVNSTKIIFEVEESEETASNAQKSGAENEPEKLLLGEANAQKKE